MIVTGYFSGFDFKSKHTCLNTSSYTNITSFDLTFFFFSKNMFGLSGVIQINLGDFNPSFSGKIFTWSFVKVPLIATNLACSNIAGNSFSLL